MKEEKILTCISCPMGCTLNVTLENNEVVNVTGNTCNKGVTYAKLECVAPRRVVTSTVKINDAKIRRLPVKTKEAIPKELIEKCIKSLQKISVDSPIKVGDVVLKNCCDTGIDIVATREA